ncbi:hypothetical protein TH62_07630 [Bacillus sp. TH008]|nr:hypothetical protein TH62_07630 [Bacillus sp. TH008]
MELFFETGRMSWQRISGKIYVKRGLSMKVILQNIDYFSTFLLTVFSHSNLLRKSETKKNDLHFDFFVRQRVFSD